MSSSGHHNHQQQEMKFEEARLATFRDWPANAKVEAWKMARAGLLYTGQDEEVKCTFCGCLLSDWQYGDQVMSKHRQASPECPFVKNQSDNVPLVPGGGGGGGGRSPHQQQQQLAGDSGFGSQEETDDASHFVSSRSSGPGGVLESEDEGPVEMEDAHRSDPDANMKHEAARLATFHNWPLAYIRGEDLAKAGFFYLNQRDNCRCAFCGNYVGDWDTGDVPMDEHRKLFPLCGFVRGLDVGNVSIESEASSSSSTSGRGSPGHDETGLRWHTTTHSTPEKGHLSFGERYPETLGVISHHGPLHPSYATLEARMRTFRDWPPALKQQPRELSDAGFYYIGLSDQVKCFYCDGGLRNWQPEDDPWVEHARWFSKCAFVRLVKGEEYIRSCVVAKPPDSSEEMYCEQPEQREVTENEVRAVMSEAIVRQVLSMGIDASRVKMAVKRQLENYGSNFDTPEHLITAAFSVQREQERRVINENNNPSGALLGTSEERRGGRDEVNSQWEGLRQQHQQHSLHQNDDDDEEEESMELETPRPSVSRPTPAAATASSTTTSSTEMCKSPPAPPAAAAARAEPVVAEPIRPEPTKEDAETLERENARLKEARTCKVCMDNEIGVVFLPCGHLICCVNCAPSLKDCPMCRTSIQGTVRTFLS